MSELRFSLADVAGVRLAVSPANETVMSMWALADPVRAFTGLVPPSWSTI